MSSPRINWVTRDQKIILERTDEGWMASGGDDITYQEMTSVNKSGVGDCRFDSRAEALAAAQLVIPTLDTRLRMYDVILEQDENGFYNLFCMNDGTWDVYVTRIEAIAHYLPADHFLHSFSEDEWYSHRWPLTDWFSTFLAPSNRSRTGMIRAAAHWLEVVCGKEDTVRQWLHNLGPQSELDHEIPDALMRLEDLAGLH